MRKLKLLLVLCLVAIAASASKTVYFNPGAWDADGALYAAWAWETDKAGTWYTLTDANDDGIFEYTFDDAIGHLIFARISSLSDKTQFEGATIVNRAGNIDRCEDGLLYVNRGSGDYPQIAICALNPSAGDEMTSFVINPNFSSSADGWVITGQARLYNGTSFDGDKFIELTNWGSSWDATISQSINGLPNGYYLVKAACQMSGNSEIWMKLVSNGAESRFSRNGDTNGNILANGDETTIGNGNAKAGWRYTNVIAKVTDGTMTISCVGHSDVAERWGNFDHVTLTYFGDEIANNTDVTDFISNWDFWGCFNGNFNGWSIETSGGNTWVHGNTAVEFWNDNLDATFDYHQTISGLPNGKYTISASMWNTQGTPNGNSGVYGTSNGNTVFAGVSDDCDDSNLHTYTTEEIAIQNGTLQIGVKNNGQRSSNWFGVDWIKLQFVEPYISAFAKEIAAATATPLTAGKWYKFTPASTGDHTFEATTLANIIYTTTDQLKSEATGTTAGGTIALTKGTTYYIMSSSAQTLTISPQSFVYTVGEAAADVSYIQKGNTVTVTYASLGTDNPDPTLVKDFSGVTFGGNSIDVTPIANGFTFEVPSVTAATDYTLAIPADAIGYSDDGGTYNAEQEITLKTPAVYDGTYFFKVENDGALNGQYLSRGKDFGTHASIDKYGLAIKVATDGQNKSTLKPFDTDRFYRMANTYDCWADQTSNDDNAKFNLTVYNGHIRIHAFSNADAEDYFKYDNADVAETTKIWADSHSGGNPGNVLEFSLESAESHATAMLALKDSQAATAAAAAYASGNYASLNGITTVAALEAELTANYIQGDFVSASAIESVQEKYQGGQPGSGNTVETVYSNTITITEPGFYKFSMQAFYRAGSNDVTQAMHTAGIDFSPVVLFFGDSETQIKSIYDEGGLDQGIAEGYFEKETVGGAPVQYNSKWYTNGQHNSVIIFQKDYYHNDVWFYASEPGDYSYGVKYLGFANANSQWFIYSPQSVTITSYAAAADDDDYAALNAAIDAYDDAAWGFETGEYAPYKNLLAIESIDGARAVDDEVVNSKLIVNSWTTKLSLTANASEVNAISWDIADYTDDADSQKPLGWTNGDGNAIRISANYSSNTGLSQLSQKMCLNINTNDKAAIYGETSGYTMPLKANTTYKLTFSYAGWGGTSGTPNIVITDGSGTEVENVELETSTVQGNNAETAWTTATVIFKTNAAGNYKLSVSKTGNRTAFGDFDLRRLSPVYAVVGSNLAETDKAIFSAKWDAATQIDIMTEESAGVWTKTYSNLTLDAQTIAYKVIKKTYIESETATNWYDNGTGANLTIDIPVKGIYDITFTFTVSGSVVSGVATKTAEAVTIGAAGWATTVTNSALDFSGETKFKAYTATVAGSTVTLNEVDNVQEETGLVLKGDEGTYYVPVTTSTTEKGDLTGSSVYDFVINDDMDAAFNFYGLTYSDSKAKFARLNKGTIPPGKAYLKLSKSLARELTIVFDDETTGISTLNTENGVEGVYNLNGQRVTAPAKGLYIVNGKKVVKK